MGTFIKGRIKSFKFAFKGAYLLLKMEHAVIAQLVIAAVVMILGFCVGISRIEWILQIFSIGLVLTAEGFNTAIEKLCDFIHPEYHEKIGFIKDLAAGGVCFAAVCAVVVGIFIYYPYFS